MGNLFHCIKKKEMAEEITDFKEYLKKIKGLSERTVILYMEKHAHFKDKEITQGSINKLVEKFDNNSVVRAYLKSYLRYKGLHKEFDLPEKKSGAVKKRIIRPVTKEEYKKVRACAYNHRAKDGILLDLIYYGAMRRGEIGSIKTNSFNWAKWFQDPEQPCEIRIIGKGNKERIVLCDPKVMKTILDIYFKRRILNVNLDPEALASKLSSMNNKLLKNMSEFTVWHIIKKHSLKAQVGRSIRPHELRHAKATEFAENGADIRDIQVYLGHANLSTTEVYLHTNKAKALERIKALSKSL
tara:strand:+ start:143 stop:1036 length:894 start_codon:yes stop_codon:yes gene_type:complete